MTDPANQTAPAEGWAGLDAQKQVADAKQALAGEMARIDDVIAAPFLTPQGQACLAWLEQRIVDPPSWRFGDELTTAYFREGQKSLVLQIRSSVDRALARSPRTTAPTKKRKPTKGK